MVRIAYADGPAAPRVSPDDVLAVAGGDGPAHVFLGWTAERHTWLDDPTLRGVSVLAGYGTAGAVRDGRITALPVRLGSVPTMLRGDPPDVAVVAGVPRGDRYAFSRSIGWADVLAEVADRVVVEVDEDGADLGGPLIGGNIVATLPRRGTASNAAPRAVDDVDRRIADHVMSIVPDEATLQFGLGGVAEAIAGAVDRPVRLWTGLLTDAAAEIHARGLLSAPAVAAYTWGTEPVERLHADEMLDLAPVSVTHDIGRLSAIPRLVGCNGALQVGLDGSVNLEQVGGRTLAGIGGHSDFSAGASRSVGGVAVVATRSTTARGDSSIVPAVDVVSTPRSDIDVVVTEHGVADLRGASDTERASRMLAIADAEHRAELEATLA